VSLREWLQVEAERQALELSDEDLEEIAKMLQRNKEMLRARRPVRPEWLEPPYLFIPSGRDDG
jgi:hypothetical protein